MEEVINEIQLELEFATQGVNDEVTLVLLKDFRDKLAAQRITRGKHARLTPENSPWPLQPEEYERYSRQMIVPGVGLQGQLSLRSAKVLVIGAGGLGCPAATYLAGAGVGTLGIVDGDTVEVSNLHRQIGHSTARVGTKKTDSLLSYLKGINSLVQYNAHSENIHPGNAEHIVSQYDLVLDCTDRPVGRYLISDICVLLQKPLVSAAALRTDGQLIVLNCPPVPPGSKFGAPCYRCVWRDPPRPELAMTCGEFGILGPAVGIMGTMQANEAIKIITAGRHLPIPSPEQPVEPSLLVFADWKRFGVDRTAIRSVAMKKKPACVACSPDHTITLEGIVQGVPDYVEFCGADSFTQVSVPPSARITPGNYLTLPTQADGIPDAGYKGTHLLLDVREPEHFSISALPGAVNVRYREVSRWLARYDPESKAQPPAGGLGTESIMPWEEDRYKGQDIWVVCRTGQDSKDVVAKMLSKGLDKNGAIRIGDIVGGMQAWKNEVDHSMPFV